jgi:hypothetical protein
VVAHAALDPVLLLVLWAVMAGLGRLASGNKAKQQRPPPPPDGGTGSPGPPVRKAPETFEELLAEMRGQSEHAREDRIGDRAEAGALPSAEEVEERQSLEIEPVVVSLEVPVREPGREAADDRMVATQRAIDERLRAAEARNRSWRLSDHERFDAEIRRVRPDVTRVRSARPPMRQAIVWREILGPPVGLREPGQD